MIYFHLISTLFPSVRASPMEDATQEVMAKLQQESYNRNIRPSVDGGEDTYLDGTYPQGRDKEKEATPHIPFHFFIYRIAYKNKWALHFGSLSEYNTGVIYA